MSTWVMMPTTKATDVEDDCCKPCDVDDEWKYRVYIPLPTELVKQIEVGGELEIVLKGMVKRVSMSEDDKESSGEVCLRVKAAKLPSAKAPMEDYAQSLMDEEYED